MIDLAASLPSAGLMSCSSLAGLLGLKDGADGTKDLPEPAVRLAVGNEAVYSGGGVLLNGIAINPSSIAAGFTGSGPFQETTPIAGLRLSSPAAFELDLDLIPCKVIPPSRGALAPKPPGRAGPAWGASPSTFVPPSS